MQDKLEDYPEDYHYLNHEDWCDLLSTIEVKDERKRAAVQIKNIASARESSLSDSDKSARNPRKKKASTGVLRSKTPHKKAHKHHGIQQYCVICKKVGMPERKFMPHSAEDFTGVHTNQTITYGMGGSVGGRADTMNQYKKYHHKGNKELKYLKKKNKIIYSITNKYGLCCEIKNIKKKASNKGCNSISGSSSNDSDSDSSLARDIS